MKIFRVVYNEDGKTIKEPGIVSTEIKQMNVFYAAETMQQVWDDIEYIRNDVERELIGIIQDQSAVTVLKGDY